jgi:hypothetical protein
MFWFPVERNPQGAVVLAAAAATVHGHSQDLNFLLALHYARCAVHMKRMASWSLGGMLLLPGARRQSTCCALLYIRSADL